MLIDKLKAKLLIPREPHAKDSFWATETETDAFEIYHKWIGTTPTNPIEPDKLLMFEAAKMIELAIINALEKQVKIVPPDKKQHRIDMQRAGVKVTGYMDALIQDGKEFIPVEVKTIYGDYQARELTACKPRLSYLKQLAVYMDFIQAKKGILLYMDRGTGQMWEFALTREGTKFTCLNINFDLTDTYKRWAKIHQENILPKIEPSSDYQYKYPLENIITASKSDITAARTNRAVYGDWQIKYSPYKNLLIERQGCGFGYNDEELKTIKDLTKGYSTK